MKLYIPERAIFTPAALNYELGRKIYRNLEAKGVYMLKSPVNRVKNLVPGDTVCEAYSRAKKTLLVTTTHAKKLEVCRPSADWQFNLVTGCPGHCEYCYLQTTHGEKPYLRIYVNLEDIFKVIEEYVNDAPTKPVTFEAASLGDPLALEHISGALAKTIEFFGELKNGRLRVVTKFNNIDGLLHLAHNRHTHFRVSINTNYVIEKFEHGTCGICERAAVSSALISAGYPTGFIVAPVMAYEGWKAEYRNLLDTIARKLHEKALNERITFELIQHRFTKSAKELILERFPHTSLDMDESKRKLKWGKYGRFKYVYPDETARNLRDYLTSLIKDRFPNSEIEYFT